MSKKQHQKQVERARAKRRASALDRRQRRVRVIALGLAFALALSVFAVALMERGGSPTVEDEDPGAADAEQSDDPDGEDPAAASDAEACPPADDAPEPEPVEYPSEPEMAIDEEATYVATLDTTCGEIVVELDAAGAPRTVNSFVFLARDGFFEGVPFHRIIPGFVIQGGDPTGTGTGGPGYTFDDELETAQELVSEEGGYPRGRLVMANAGPDTNGSQFFITLEDLDGQGGRTQLPPQYALFGEVIDGMETVDRIAAEPTEGELAVDPVRIRSVTIDES